MQSLTYKNHLHWSLRLDGVDSSFADRTLPEQQFIFDVGRVSVPTLSWYEEFVRAMSKLMDEHGTDLHVMYSGGFDSEILVRTLHSLGANLTVHTIMFSGGENYEDTKNATETCLQLGLRQNSWPIDIHEYVADQRYLDAGVKYSCTQIAYIIVLDHVHRVSSGPVLMGGEIYLQKHMSPGIRTKTPMEWYYVFREDEDGALFRYAVKNDHCLINEVFSYTPELVSAWVNAPYVRRITDGEILGKLSLITSKPQIYAELYPGNLVANKKMHGYEQLMSTNRMVRNHMQSLLLPMSTALLPVKELQV